MKKFNKKDFFEKIRKHSGEIFISIIAIVLLITLLSVSVPFLSELFNKDKGISDQTITNSVVEQPATNLSEPDHQHTHTKNKTINPTCLEKGYTVYLCSCGDTYKADYKDALGHNWSAWVVTKQPTEKEKGTETRTCKRCGIKENRSIDKLKSKTQQNHEHSYSKNKTINPTCLEKGYTVYLCSCSDTYKADYKDALGHNWSAWVVTKQPTEKEKGTETRICKRCGINENRSIDKLPQYVYPEPIDIWTDGSKTYYSSLDGKSQWILVEDHWETITWKGFLPAGRHIWTDGTDIYYSCYKNQYKLNSTTDTWEPITWNGFTPESGRYIWTDGTDYYYSPGNSREDEYKLTGNTWIHYNWNTVTDSDPFGRNGLSASDIWTDGKNIFRSNFEGDGVYRQYQIYKGKLYYKTWEGFTEIIGEDVWTDGANMYYSSPDLENKEPDHHYILNGNTWEKKVWNGLIPKYGHKVWSDGINTYYSCDEEQYVLNKNTGNWEIKNWTLK